MPNPAGLSEAELPDWAPLTWHVADYLPHRTLAESVVSTTQGQDEYRLTFDDTTRPTGHAVSRLIADGVAWVSARVTPLHTSSQATAAVLACLWAAVHVERGWPQDDTALERARDLEKTANDMLAGLVAANTAANGQDPDTGQPVPAGSSVLPVWSFPPADARYDSPAHW